MIVVDASAALPLLVADRKDLGERLLGEDELVAPHLIDIEVLSALRRGVRRGVLSPDRAIDALGDLEDLAFTRFSHEPLLGRVWELRENLTAYDASYLALAEIIGIPLVTCDAGMAGVPGSGANVELFPAN